MRESACSARFAAAISTVGCRCWFIPTLPGPPSTSPRTLDQRAVEFSVGASLGHFDIHAAVALLPGSAWTPAYQARKPRAEQHGVHIEPHDGAWVAEVSALVDLSAWPVGTRLILRKQRPHPGAQLRITDVDGMRITGFFTNTAPGRTRTSARRLKLRHRCHARVEDRIRAAKDTGLRNLPHHDFAQNQV